MNDELKHHGILGMKWGIRRYQPYPKGKGHKGRFIGRKPPRDAFPKKTKKERHSEDHKRVTQLRKKKVRALTNQELKELTTRLQLETQYENLKQAEKSKGKNAVSSILVSAGKQSATKYISRAIDAGIDKIIGSKVLKKTEQT